MTAETRAAEVLAEHSWSAALGGCNEPCLWQSTHDEDEQINHAIHVAAALAAAGCLRDDREGETVTAERAWSDALEAVAWCLDNGESSVTAALAYIAKNNPHAAPVTPDGGDQ